MQPPESHPGQPDPSWPRYEPAPEPTPDQPDADATSVLPRDESSTQQLNYPPQPGETAYLPPVYGQHQQPGYQQPQYQQPGYQQPQYQQPGYQQPQYQQPGYQQPGYQQPGYQQPQYQQPQYQQPGYQQPGYQQPQYQQPGYPYQGQQNYGYGAGQTAVQPAYQGGSHAAAGGRDKKSGARLWIAVLGTAIVVAVVLVILFVAPGAAVTKKLSHSAVQSTITSQSSGQYTGVLCNGGADATVKTGATFTCTANGGKQIRVTMTDGKGAYTWTPLN